MIQRLHADCIGLQEQALVELRQYIRGDLRVAGTAVEAAFLVCVV